MFAGLLGLVALAVALHGVGLGADRLGDKAMQLMVMGRGEFLAVLFAALLGGLAITGEIRHGTIRPTFIVTPRRERVIAAKMVVSALVGATFGLSAAVVATGVGAGTLQARGVEVLLDGGDHALLVLGSAAAAALSAAIGVGVGAIIRNQVPTLIGISAWLLFIEGLLVGDTAGDVADVGRFAPGALAAAVSGQGAGELVAPAIGIFLLAAYAGVTAIVGAFVMARRDVA